MRLTLDFVSPNSSHPSFTTSSSFSLYLPWPQVFLSFDKDVWAQNSPFGPAVSNSFQLAEVRKAAQIWNAPGKVHKRSRISCRSQPILPFFIARCRLWLPVQMTHHAAFVCAGVGWTVLQAAATQVEGGLDDWLKKWCTAEVPYPLDRWAGCWETF